MTSRRALNIAGATLSLLCLAYFARTAAAYAGDIGPITAAAGRGLLFALAIYLGAYIAFAAAWTRLLGGTGNSVPFTAGAAMLWTAQFGKYLPGNFAHHVGRVALAGRFGLGAGPVVAAMAAETALVLALVALLALPAVGELGKPWGAWYVGVLAIGLPLIGGGVLLRRRRRRPAGAAPRLPATEWAAATALLAVAIILSGGSLLPLTGAAAPADLLRLIPLFCVAWLAGFVVPGAPAGLGVRELVLAEGLSPLVGAEGAIAASLLFRLVTVAADLIAFVAGLLLLRHVDAAPRQGIGDGSAAARAR